MDKIGHIPQRTCIGCRGVADRSTLLRVVARGGDGGGEPLRVIPDEVAVAPGRGAWLHPTRACLERAVTRRAFARALRLGAAVDVTAIEQWLTQHHASAALADETT